MIGVNTNTSISKVSSSNSTFEVPGQAEGMIHPIDKLAESRRLNPEALMRGFYVFAGLSVIVLVYIAWKSCGKRSAQLHKYGVVANREDLEMAPLDSDDGDGDEDTTHFDISKHRT